MQEVIPEDVQIETMDIWFQDEARVGQRGTMSRIWAQKGTRIRLVRQQQFEYAYIFGAVCPARDESVRLVMPYVNTEAMLIHLEHISELLDCDFKTIERGLSDLEKEEELK